MRNAGCSAVLLARAYRTPVDAATYLFALTKRWLTRFFGTNVLTDLRPLQARRTPGAHHPRFPKRFPARCPHQPRLSKHRASCHPHQPRFPKHQLAPPLHQSWFSKQPPSQKRRGDRPVPVHGHGGGRVVKPAEQRAHGPAGDGELAPLPASARAPSACDSSWLLPKASSDMRCRIVGQLIFRFEASRAACSADGRFGFSTSEKNLHLPVCPWRVFRRAFLSELPLAALRLFSPNGRDAPRHA